jgi:putative Mn2+ efflux pump MntP
MIRVNLLQMEKVMELISNQRLQYLVFLGLSTGIAVLIGIVYASNHLLFQRFFGRINPLVAFLLIFFVGVILLSFLLSQGWFAIYERENLKGPVVIPVLQRYLG